jgi:hypothetical protein
MFLKVKMQKMTTNSRTIFILLKSDIGATGEFSGQVSRGEHDTRFINECVEIEWNLCRRLPFAKLNCTETGNYT